MSMRDALGALGFFKGIKDRQIAQAENARSQRIELQTWTFLKLTDQYNTAQSDAQRQNILDQMQYVYNTTEPSIKMAIAPYLKRGPMDPIKLAGERFDRLHKDMKPKITMTPDDNPALYGQQMIEVQTYGNMKRVFQGLPKKEILPFTFANSKGQNYLTVPDFDGGIPHTFPFEHADAERIASKYNKTGAALLADGGYVTSWRSIVPKNDGQYLVELKENKLVGGPVKWSERKINDFTKNDGSGGGGGKIKGSRSINSSLEKGFWALQAGKAKKNDVAMAIESHMEELLDSARHLSDEEKTRFLSIEMNRFLKTKDPHFNYRVVDADYPFYIFSPSIKLKGKGTILYTPGEMGELDIGAPFDKPAKVFVDYYDRKNPLYYRRTDDPRWWGELLGPRDLAIAKLRRDAELQMKRKKDRPTQERAKKERMPGDFRIRDLRPGWPTKDPDASFRDIAEEQGD